MTKSFKDIYFKNCHFVALNLLKKNEQNFDKI